MFEILVAPNWYIIFFLCVCIHQAMSCSYYHLSQVMLGKCLCDLFTLSLLMTAQEYTKNYWRKQILLNSFLDLVILLTL